MSLLIVLGYFFLTLWIGIHFRKQASAGPVEFFLAGRKLKPLLLFFTMTATNFSAFTIFGLSGEGYRSGYSFYPIMGFGTGFMATTFVFIGHKILVLSRERNYVTPSDFIFDRYGSKVLGLTFSALLVLFTLPYIAIQTIAAGKTLYSIMGMPYLIGAGLVTVFITLYVTLGGLRSIAWTDVVQGIMMILFTLLSFLIITKKAGGFVGVHEKLLITNPDHLSRPGTGGAFPPGIWLGYMVLWFFADPMFPQLFQRFMAAKDRKALNLTVVLYPLITTGLFFLTVSIGVIGKAVFPDLSAAQTDSIFPLLMKHYAGNILGTVLLTGSIAALMSTLDSQLLTVSSILIRDFTLAGRWNIREKNMQRLLIVLIAGAGFLLAINPPDIILDFINKTTFNGLAVLFPAVVGGLYWRRGNHYGALASIFTGELMVVLFYFGVLSPLEREPMLPILPIMAVTILVYVIVSLLSQAEENMNIVFSVSGTALIPTAAFGVLFLLGNDFWNWEKAPVLHFGLPGWIWYFIGLGILLSGTYAIWLLRKKPVVSSLPKAGKNGTTGSIGRTISKVK
jgi:SSS family solute:Na+ symporter